MAALVQGKERSALESQGVMKDSGAVCCMCCVHYAKGILDYGIGTCFVMMYVHKTLAINELHKGYIYLGKRLWTISGESKGGKLRQVGNRRELQSRWP